MEEFNFIFFNVVKQGWEINASVSSCQI